MIERVVDAMRIAAITGTNGKSSCAIFYAQALVALGQPCAVVGTLGAGVWPDLVSTGMTTPDAKQLRPIMASFEAQKIPYGAFEASSHGLVQNRLAEVRVHQAVLTNITQDHLDYHGTMAEYKAAKRLLFERDLAWRIFNLDDAVGQAWSGDYAHAKDAQLLTYGWRAEGKKPDVYAEDVVFSAQGFQATLHTPWGSGLWCSTLLGGFNVSNSLVVVALLGTLGGVSFEDLRHALAQLQTVTGRMQRVLLSEAAHDQALPEVVVDFAHTPDALQQVLTTLRPACRGRLWCVLGCGGDRDRSKRPEMAAIAEKLADAVVFTDDNPRTEPPDQIVADMRTGLRAPSQMCYIGDRAKAIMHAIQAAAPEDTVLLAGKGHETVQIVGDQHMVFDDAVHARDALAVRCASHDQNWIPACAGMTVEGAGMTHTPDRLASLRSPCFACKPALGSCLGRSAGKCYAFSCTASPSGGAVSQGGALLSSSSGGAVSQGGALLSSSSGGAVSQGGALLSSSSGGAVSQRRSRPGDPVESMREAHSLKERK